MISYYWELDWTLTLTELWLLSLLISLVKLTIWFLNDEIVLYLSSIKWAFGWSLCHLTYLALKTSFSFSNALKALWSLKKFPSVPWISPMIFNGYSMYIFLTSLVNTVLMSVNPLTKTCNYCEILASPLTFPKTMFNSF